MNCNHDFLAEGTTLVLYGTSKKIACRICGDERVLTPIDPVESAAIKEHLECLKFKKSNVPLASTEPTAPSNSPGSSDKSQTPQCQDTLLATESATTPIPPAAQGSGPDTKIISS